MKKYNNIDEFFKEEVSGYQVTPSDKVWENIEKEYFKANTFGRRNVMILALISLLLITGSIITWTMFSNRPEQNIFTDNSDKVTVNNNPIQNTEIKNGINTNQNPEIVTSQEESEIIVANEEETSLNTSQTTHTTVLPPNDKEVKNETNYQTSNQPKSNDAFYIDLSNQLNLTNYFELNKMSSKNTTTIQNSCTPSLIEDFDKITVDEYIEKRKNLHFYTGASASIAMVYYSSSVDQTTWTADLVYGLKLKRYYIETGVGFQKMKEQGDFDIEYKTNDSIGYYNEVTSFELNPENPNEITYKTKTTTVYDSIEHHHLQSPLYSYDYIVVPIKFGYKFYQKTHFSVSAETGIIYSYLTKTYTPEVDYSDPESQLIGITNNTPDRVDHNFRLHVALRLNYNITKTISLTAQPEFSSYLNSIYKQSYSGNAKPYTMGIRFGIYFDF